MRFAPLVLIFGVMIAGLGYQREVSDSSFSSRARSPASVPSVVKDPVEIHEKKNSADSVTSLWPKDGERWVYRFERKASAEHEGRSWLNLKLGGLARIEAVGTHGDHRFYQLTYEIDRMEMQGVEKNEKRAFPKARVEIDSSGHLRELRWMSESASFAKPGDEDADLVRDLTAQWLFFETRSRLGLSEAGFTMNAKSDQGVSITKQVLRYPSRSDFTSLDSIHEWTTRDEKVERVEGTENFRTGDLEQKTSYRWVWITTERVYAVTSASLTGSVFSLDDGTADGVTTSNESRVQKRLGLKDLASAWPGLSRMSARDRLMLFRDLRDALDAGQSEFVPFLVNSVRGQSSVSFEWRTGVGALASSSNPEAAQALLELYKDPSRHTDEKLSILAGVTAGEGRPSPEWKKVFETEVGNGVSADDSDLRAASLFALGSTIRKESNAERRRELEVLLWKEVKESTTESAQVTVLDAIGNSGSPEYYSYVKECFASASPVVRAKAVSAVRFLAYELAKPVIDSARADSAAVVRKAAAFSEKFLESAVAEK